MRWDVFLRADCEQLGFSSKVKEIFVKEQFASKLRGVLIEDDDEESDFDGGEDGANASSSSFPLDSTRTSMLAMALMYQDLKARSTRRAEELRGENGDEKEESSRDDYSPHWQAYVDLLPTNVDSLLLWSTEELAFLQNSRIGERAKRRKKLVAEEFQVLFSNASLREEFERLMMPQTKQTQTQTTTTKTTDAVSIRDVARMVRMGVRHGISARVYASGNRKRRFAPLSGLGYIQFRERRGEMRGATFSSRRHLFARDGGRISRRNASLSRLRR